MGKVGLGHQYWVGKCLRGLFTGLITGALISLYSQTISLLTRLNQSLPFLVFLIPLGAVLTQYLFKVFGERYRNSTTSAIDEINNLGVVKIRLRSMIAAVEEQKRRNHEDR